MILQVCPQIQSIISVSYLTVAIPAYLIWPKLLSKMNKLLVFRRYWSYLTGTVSDKLLMKNRLMFAWIFEHNKEECLVCSDVLERGLLKLRLVMWILPRAAIFWVHWTRFITLKTFEEGRIGVFEVSTRGNWLITLKVFGEEGTSDTRWLFPYILSRPFVEMVYSPLWKLEPFKDLKTFGFQLLMYLYFHPYKYGEWTLTLWYWTMSVLCKIWQ